MTQQLPEPPKPSLPFSVPLPREPVNSAHDSHAFDNLLLSQERFSQFFHTFPHYCYVISPSGTILDVNPTACDALGYAKEELLGKPLSTIYAPESLAKMCFLFERWKQLGVIRDEEMVIRAKRGQKRTVLLNARAVKDANGNILHSVSVQIDITEQKQTEEQFRASEEHIRGIVQCSPIAMLVTEGSEQRIILMNDRFTDLFRYTLDDVPDAAHWWPLAYPDADYRDSVKAEWQVRVEKALRDRTEIEPMEAIVRCGDGSRRNIEFHFSARTETNIVSFIDVTDRKRAETVLQESEERFRLVANTAPVMIWMSSTDKLCNYFNSRWLEFTGRALEEELGNGWTEGVHPEDLPCCLETYATAFGRREPFRMEYRLRRHDGEYRWIFDIGVPRFGPDDSFAGYIGSCMDITERKQAEEALSSVSRQLIEAHEEERTRIARELHDDVNQRLALAAISLEKLQGRIPESDLQIREHITEIKQQIKDLGIDVQTISHRLHSSKLEYLGLSVAAGGFCREFSERKGVHIDFYSEHIPKSLPQEISLCLFRVLQEALQNAAKHSGSQDFQVRLTLGSEEVQLTVSDSGSGFSMDEALITPGLGITSMRERLKIVRGELQIDSRKGLGTLVQARVPIPIAVPTATAARV